MKNYVLRHKIFSAIVLIVLLGGGYWAYAKLTDTSDETKYVISAVEKGTIVATISGTGQVSAKSQIELKPKASGEIVYLGAKTGDYVSAGQLILQIDSRDAEIDLKNAKLTLQKMVEGVGSLGGTSGLAKDYEEGMNNVDEAFSGLSEIMEGLDIILNDYKTSPYKMNLPNDTARTYYNKAVKSYFLAKPIYEKNLARYQSLSRPLTNDSVASTLNETYSMLQVLSQMIKDSNVYLAYTYDKSREDESRSVIMATDKDNVATWLKTVSNNLSAIGVSRDTIKNSALNIESQRLTLQQKEYAYQNYFLYAPFSGLAQIDITRNDSVSNGSSIGSLVSVNKVATISLNEVDVTKVKVGQKATLTFDAIENLTISGLVWSVDQVGTVSSGVVNYNVKISFDTQDPRVLPGMSVNASIATNARQDVLIVPSGAVKISGDISYVQMLDQSLPVTGNQGVASTLIPAEQEVVVGISDDTSTEIISGLKEGDKIITRIIAPGAVKAASAPSLFGSTGGSRSSVRGASVGSLGH